MCLDSMQACAQGGKPATDTAAFGGGNVIGDGVKNIRETTQQVLRLCIV